MEIAGSARKHSIPDEDIHHAVTNAIWWHELDDLFMVIGPTTAGNLIEVGIIEGDTDQVVIHAMPARPMFLPRPAR